MQDPVIRSQDGLQFGLLRREDYLELRIVWNDLYPIGIRKLIEPQVLLFGEHPDTFEFILTALVGSSFCG